MKRLANFVNGEFIPPQNGKYIENFDPATGEAYSELPDSDAIDVVMAVKAANEAFISWSKTPAQVRAQVLFRIADLLEVHADELAAVESRDVGKPYWLARDADMVRAISVFRFFASKILTEQTMAADMDGQAVNYVLRQPLGVGGLISPWNLPFYLLSWKLAPCIAVGNTAVCKPSELTPMTASLFANLLNEAGLPKGVCNIIFGRGETAGAALVQHPGVPLISFTGGTDTGVNIQSMAASQLKKVGLELGGKNANIIFKDADLQKAVEGTLRSSFLNSGQICLCGSRLLVQEEIYEAFMSEFKKRTTEVHVGDPSLKETFMGPLVSAGHKEKVLAAIAQAKKEGGRVTVGGDEPVDLPEKFRKGYFLRPTIIEDLTGCSDLWQREIFGPLVTVQKFKYPQDAVKLANNTTYGLSASLWTSNVTRAHKVAAQIHAGTVWINSWALRDLRVPFGGMKASGVGREGGDCSLDFFTEAKNICVGLC